MYPLKTLNTWFMAAIVVGTTMLSTNAGEDYKFKTKGVNRTPGMHVGIIEEGADTFEIAHLFAQEIVLDADTHSQEVGFSEMSSTD